MRQTNQEFADMLKRNYENAKISYERNPWDHNRVPDAKKSYNDFLGAHPEVNGSLIQ